MSEQRDASVPHEVGTLGQGVQDPQPHGESSDRSTWNEAVRRDPGVVGDSLLIALAIGSTANTNGTGALYSVQALARDTGRSVATVKRRLAELVAGGWLRRAQRGGRRGDGKVEATVYRLTAPTLDPLAYPQNPLTERLTRVSRSVSTAQGSASTGHPGEPLRQSQQLTDPLSTAHLGEPPLKSLRDSPQTGVAQHSGYDDRPTVQSKLGCTEDEAAAVVALCARPGIRNPAAYAASLTTPTLRGHLKTVREAAAAAARIESEVEADAARVDALAPALRAAAEAAARSALKPQADPPRRLWLRTVVNEAKLIAREESNG